MEQRTASRPPADSQSGPTEAEIAAAIALILAGQVVVASVGGAIASLLKLIPGLPDLSGDDVSAPVARMVSGIKRDAPSRSERLTAASQSNLAHRAHYAIEAVKRIATKVKNGGAIADALNAEHTYLRQHLEASEARTQGHALNEAAARRWGPVLSWQHAASRKGAASHRPSHVAADGANFDVRNPPESTDGMLPGMALHCDCLAGPPIAGARMLR